MLALYIAEGANCCERVPILEWKRQALSESMAMLDLIEDLQPEPPLTYTDPWLRARVRAALAASDGTAGRGGRLPIADLTLAPHSMRGPPRLRSSKKRCTSARLACSSAGGVQAITAER